MKRLFLKLPAAKQDGAAREGANCTDWMQWMGSSNAASVDGSMDWWRSCFQRPDGLNLTPWQTEHLAKIALAQITAGQSGTRKR
jgi:hypothetical protein